MTTGLHDEDKENRSEDAIVDAPATVPLTEFSAEPPSERCPFGLQQERKRAPMR